MKTLTSSDKRKMLFDAVVLNYSVGYMNLDLVGNSLSYYDYDKLFEYIVELNEENIEQGGSDLFEDKKDYFGYKVKSKKRR